MFKTYFLSAFFSFILYNCVSQTTFSEDSIRYYLNNQTIKIGFDKRIGGVVSYFTRLSHGANLINNHDAGRQTGFETRIYPTEPTTWRPYTNSKYLSDVYPFAGGATREWNGLPQGSFYNENFSNKAHLGGNPEKVSFDERSGVLYIKSKLWEWGFVNDSSGVLKKIDAGGYNEYWITLDGIATHFSVKQTRNIPYFVTTDNTYVTLNIFLHLNFPYASKWHTYNQSSPYTNQPANVKTSFWPGEPNYANFWDYTTENWVALTNDEDFGAGIYIDNNRVNVDPKWWFLYGEKQLNGDCGRGRIDCPDEDRYSFGMISVSNYVFPCGVPCATAGNVTTTNFSIMAGSVTEMREFAYAKHTKPCEKTMVLSSMNDDFGVPVTRKSELLIEADNTISEAATNLTTGKYIVLKPGFKVQNGAVFNASVKVNPCD